MKGREDMHVIDIWPGDDFDGVKAFYEGEEPMFVGKDVCKAIGISNHNRTLSRIDNRDKRMIEITDSLGRKQKAIAVNESGFYDILLSFTPQRAHHDGSPYEYPIEVQRRIDKVIEFRNWVCRDVLPSIRKYGFYFPGIDMEKIMNDPGELAKAITQFPELGIKILRAVNERMAEGNYFSY